MKHLCRRSEPQSFAGTVIQSVFDHFNFLVSNACHLALLGHILPQQAVEVLVGATLPTGKGPGKVARAAQRLINLGMPAKLFAVVVGQGLDPGFKGCTLLAAANSATAALGAALLPAVQQVALAA